MLVTLNHSDGSDQTVDVAGLRLSIDGRPLELTPEASPSQLRFHSPSDEHGWQHFVVHHSAANRMILEVVSHTATSRNNTPE